jgi:hypothetical protein
VQTKDRSNDIRVEPYRERYPFGLLAVPFTIANKDKPCRVQEKERAKHGGKRAVHLAR